jgi:hypothetical protein
MLQTYSTNHEQQPSLGDLAASFRGLAVGRTSMHSDGVDFGSIAALREDQPSGAIQTALEMANALLVENRELKRKLESLQEEAEKSRVLMAQNNALKLRAEALLREVEKGRGLMTQYTALKLRAESLQGDVEKSQMHSSGLMTQNTALKLRVESLQKEVEKKRSGRVSEEWSQDCGRKYRASTQSGVIE